MLRRNWTNTGQGRRRLNARAALRQQERSRSPAPSCASVVPSGLGRTASLGMLPGPNGQLLGDPKPTDGQPAGRARSAGMLERTRFLPARSTRCFQSFCSIKASCQASPSSFSEDQSSCSAKFRPRTPVLLVALHGTTGCACTVCASIMAGS